jgi:hypothetical protein
MLAGAKIYAGTLVAIDPANGFARAATAAAGIKIVGVAAYTIDNTAGANGDKSIVVYNSNTANGTREFPFINNPADALAIKDFGATCYALDDQTVTATASGKSAAGTVVGFTPDLSLVYVRFAL